MKFKVTLEAVIYYLFWILCFALGWIFADLFIILLDSILEVI